MPGRMVNGSPAVLLAPTRPFRHSPSRLSPTACAASSCTAISKSSRRNIGLAHSGCENQKAMQARKSSSASKTLLELGRDDLATVFAALCHRVPTGTIRVPDPALPAHTYFGHAARILE